MKPVLLDTGCIVALLDRSERHHEHCVEVVTELSAPLVTCEAVIAESCYLLRSVERAAAAVLDNVDAGVFRVPFRLDASGAAVKRLLQRYRNVPMDLADGCLVQMADELETGEILTLDSDFEVYRWRRSRKFRNLLS
ncbi:MAG: PIN domain-containing protein [Polyangiaceae bacterium]|nr:PIN domain-containing protein [Polyangiaceae bacterium]